MTYPPPKPENLFVIEAYAYYKVENADVLDHVGAFKWGSCDWQGMCIVFENISRTAIGCISE